MVATEELIYEDYKNALLAGDKVKCKSIINDLIEQEADILSVYQDFFQRSLYEVGEMWEQNKISVAREHLATSITGNLMNLFYPLIFSVDKIGYKAIVTCVAKEYHQIGAKMVADIFEIEGWDTYFLGANTPSNELIRFIAEQEPNVLAISLAIYSNYPRLLEVIKLVEEHYPDLPIIVGGQAFKCLATDILADYPKIKYVPSIDELRLLLNEQGSNL
jgi:MerR family transcriptional regulator, light-induced transcriptional regulator